MQFDPNESIAALQSQIARLGWSMNANAITPPLKLHYGHRLPDTFIWFWRNFPDRSKWPASFAESIGYGFLSPFGDPSELARRNAFYRQDPLWPSKWIVFWTGSDDDLCFSYEDDGRVWIANHYYNAQPPHEDDPRSRHPDAFQATGFVEWFTIEIDRLLKKE